MNSEIAEIPEITVKIKRTAVLTGDVTEEFVSVEAPGSREEQILQLTKLMHARYPEAEFRVFHLAAGSFTFEDLHIVASYQGDVEAGFRRRAQLEKDRRANTPSLEDAGQLTLSA